jgi:hypothetical protein
MQAYYYGDAWQEAGGGGAVVNESAVRQVAEDLEIAGLYPKIMQLDDWWYPGPQSVYVHCVSNWTLTPPAFNLTLGELSQAIKTPFLLYVPFFCGEENGGNVYQRNGFRFVQGVGGRAQFAEPHPDDSERFYNMLFTYGVANGMRGYEHDFLNYNLLSVPHFRRVYDSSSKWLRGMNVAGLRHKVPIQLCMGLPSDIMSSLELNAVTNYRGSTDYALSDYNIDLGGSALLAFALGIRPSKDTLWTRRPESAIETGKPYGGVKNNPGSNCELNAMIAVLSTGPFGISDKANSTNATIVSRACRSDGLIIQPDRPASYIDAMFDDTTILGANTIWSHNTGQHPARGHVWSTHVAINATVTYFVLSIDIKIPYQLSALDLYPPPCMMHQVECKSNAMVVYRWGNRCVNGTDDAVRSGCVTIAEDANRLATLITNDRGVAVKNDTHTFDLHQFAPILSNGWVLLGDLQKYVSVSSKRFASILTTSHGALQVTAIGVANESMQLTALRAERVGSRRKWSVVVVAVQFDSSCRTVQVHGQSSPACTKVVTWPDTRSQSRSLKTTDEQAEVTSDVVVYGANSAGVIAAVAAAREGATVSLLCNSWPDCWPPNERVGGLTTGGLGFTDSCHQSDSETRDLCQDFITGALTKEFYNRTASRYFPHGWLPPQATCKGVPGTLPNTRSNACPGGDIRNPPNMPYNLEPSVALEVYHELMSEVSSKLRVFYSAQVDPIGVTKSGAVIDSIVLDDGRKFVAKTWVDASYEGDLLRFANVTYTVGRESRAQYNESWAGRRHGSDGGENEWRLAINPYDSKGKLLPGLLSHEDAAKIVPIFQGDNTVMAYNFRLCVTQNKSNMIPFQKPDEYHPEDWELLRRYLNQTPGAVMPSCNTGEVPNGKFDMNNCGPIASDLQTAEVRRPLRPFGRPL